MKRRIARFFQESKREKEYRFLFSCVGSGDGPGIQEMAEHARQITWTTFRKNVPLNEIRQRFPDYSYRGEMYNPYTGELTIGFHLKDDWAVSFWSGRYRGERCYYVAHSGIEYIWTKRRPKGV